MPKKCSLLNYYHMASMRWNTLKKTSGLTRKLTDIKVQHLGAPVGITLMKNGEAEGSGSGNIQDFYGNTPENIVEYRDITAILIIPPEFPVDRYRQDISKVTVDTTTTFFYEILPISLYTRWEDNVERGDYFLYTIEDEVGNNIPIVFRVSETLGSFRESMVWKTQYCAPFNGILPDDVRIALGL